MDKSTTNPGAAASFYIQRSLKSETLSVYFSDFVTPLQVDLAASFFQEIDFVESVAVIHQPDRADYKTHLLIHHSFAVPVLDSTRYFCRQEGITEVDPLIHLIIEEASHVPDRR